MESRILHLQKEGEKACKLTEKTEKKAQELLEIKRKVEEMHIKFKEVGFFINSNVYKLFLRKWLKRKRFFKEKKRRSKR